MLVSKALTWSPGKSFQVISDSEETIRKGHITQLPSNHDVMNDPVSDDFLRQVEEQIMLSMFSKAHNLPGQDLRELFPDVCTTDLEDFLRTGWAIKQSTA